MKKTVCVILSVLLIVCISGCNKETDTKMSEPSDGTYEIFPMEQNDRKVNTEIIDRYLLDNYESFAEIKKNCPAILSHLADITPKALEDICTIYRFSYESSTGVAGSTFLICDNVVYPIGVSFGGDGITEFAYLKSDNQSVLYFIYSFGSGIHRSHIGSFNFDTKELSDCYIEDFYRQDITFNLSKDKKMLGICKAQITWPNFSLMGVTITKGEVMHKDINAFEFKPVNND